MRYHISTKTHTSSQREPAKDATSLVRTANTAEWPAADLVYIRRRRKQSAVAVIEYIGNRYSAHTDPWQPDVWEFTAVTVWSRVGLITTNTATQSFSSIKHPGNCVHAQYLLSGLLQLASVLHKDVLIRCLQSARTAAACRINIVTTTHAYCLNFTGYQQKKQFRSIFHDWISDSNLEISKFRGIANAISISTVLLTVEINTSKSGNISAFIVG